jgi:hypothetical protein
MSERFRLSRAGRCCAGTHLSTIVLRHSTASCSYGAIAQFVVSMQPKRSLNADVPHVGLRPGSWPPVSLIR